MTARDIRRTDRSRAESYEAFDDGDVLLDVLNVLLAASNMVEYLA